MKQEQRMTIDFEKDQEEVLDKTTNINKLADKIKEMQVVQKAIALDEEQIKQKKKHLEYLSGEVVPTMLSEMGLSFLKLQDGSSVEVKTNYSATITQANKEAAFNWLRENGLGDIIKNEISVSLKALVRERMEAGKEMPTELFNIYVGNKTTIKRKQ
jgi:hypothetical protein